MHNVDVVVVGAGPVGLLAAVELALGGARVVVLERLAVASTTSKALGIGPLGCEALQRRGMGPALDTAEASALATMASSNGSAAPARGPRFSGHFGGLSLIRKDVQKQPERRARLVDQQAVERMLAERVRALGIDVRRGGDVTGIVQREDAVDVTVATPAGEDRIRGDWLVGCDGGRSFVRKTTGFAFPGTSPTLTMYTAVVAIDHPERLVRGGWTRTPGGIYSWGAFPGRLFLLDFSGPPADRDAPVTRDEIESVLRRLSERDVRVTALESASRWSDNTRLVDRYRRGNVFLAGDAAHVHSPFGGQGMSLGLSDAANLGWKLAAVIRGDLPDRLLDSYTIERRPVAAAVLANTLAQTAIMRPDAQAGAMRDLVAELMQFDDVNRRLGEMTSGLSARYDLGSDRDDVGRLIGDRPIGRDGAEVALYDAMQDGTGVLLDASADRAASRRATGTPKVRCVAVDRGPSMLIRPDACVAWADEAGGTDGLDDALRRWFGSAANASSGGDQARALAAGPRAAAPVP